MTAAVDGKAHWSLLYYAKRLCLEAARENHRPTPYLWTGRWFEGQLTVQKIVDMISIKRSNRNKSARMRMLRHCYAGQQSGMSGWPLHRVLRHNQHGLKFLCLLSQWMPGKYFMKVGYRLMITVFNAKYIMFFLCRIGSGVSTVLRWAAAGDL